MSEIIDWLKYGDSFDSELAIQTIDKIESLQKELESAKAEIARLKSELSEKGTGEADE